MARLELSAERKKWPYEAFVKRPDGSRFFSTYARPNADGTVTVATFEPPQGYVETMYPAEQVILRLSAELRKVRWFWLYEDVYGGDRRGDA